jgi:hypothetical protein
LTPDTAGGLSRVGVERISTSRRSQRKTQPHIK